MFVTYEALKFPLQLDNQSTVWRGVEVMLNVPWLLAMAEDEEEVSRTFLLKGTDDLLQFVASKGFGRLTGLRLVFPPVDVHCGDWRFLAIRRVDRELRSIDGAMPSAVLTSDDGRCFGGFPIDEVHRDAKDLSPVVELAVPER